MQRNRLAGLRDGLAEVGVAWSAVPVWERFEHSVEAGQSAAAELLAAHPEVTAIACTSDILALGALRHAVDQGLTVPADLTVTGFDGVPEAERAGLTTVWQPVLEKGRAAGELIRNGVKAVAGGDGHRHSILARVQSGPGGHHDAPHYLREKRCAIRSAKDAHAAQDCTGSPTLTAHAAH